MGKVKVGVAGYGVIGLSILQIFETILGVGEWGAESSLVVSFNIATIVFDLLFIALAKVGTGGSDVITMATNFFVQELSIGIAVGLVVTAIGSWLYHQAWKLGWIVTEWRRLPVVMLSLTCFSVAQTLHGSGFIAAFVGGLLFGHIARRIAHDLVLDTEGIGETLGMLTWALFGVPGRWPADSYSYARMDRANQDLGRRRLQRPGRAG